MLAGSAARKRLKVSPVSSENYIFLAFKTMYAWSQDAKNFLIFFCARYYCQQKLAIISGDLRATYSTFKPENFLGNLKRK